MTRAWIALACGLGLLLAGRESAGWDVFLDLERAVPSFQVEEFQPDSKWAGRINTITVHPTDTRRLTVASESGGLFQSDDGGETWHHLDGLPAWRTVSVACYAADPQILVATALEDFKAVSGAGIWRSTDGGETWAKASIPGSCSSAAWEITVSISGAILFVATKRAYVSVEYDASRGRLTIMGARFQRDHAVTVLLDGQPVRRKIEPHKDGRFVVKLRPLVGPGQHAIRAEQRVGKLVVFDTTDFLVPSADGTQQNDDDDGDGEDQDADAEGESGTP